MVSVGKIVANPKKFENKSLVIVVGQNSLLLGSDPSLQQKGLNLTNPVEVVITDPITHKDVGTGPANINFLYASPTDSTHELVFVAPEYQNPNQFQNNLQQGIDEANSGAAKAIVTGQVENVSFHEGDKIVKGLGFFVTGQIVTTASLCGSHTV